MNDDKERAVGREESGDLQPCCDGGSCCPSGPGGAGKNWKIAVFVLVVVAAGAVLARSIIRKSGLATDQGQGAFAAIQSDAAQDTPSPQNTDAATQDPPVPKGEAGNPAVATAKTPEGISDKASPVLWGAELDSLASLNDAAADTDAVFILLAVDDQESSQAAMKEIEAAAKTIQSNGVRISAFRLKQGTPDFVNLAKQLSVPGVLAMVKGGGISGVSADQITETKLVQAFVAASRPNSGCCPPGSGATCP